MCNNNMRHQAWDDRDVDHSDFNCMSCDLYFVEDPRWSKERQITETIQETEICPICGGHLLEIYVY